MNVLNYTFKSTLEFFQMAEALASHSQRREEGGRWTGGLSFKEAMELPKVGWNPEKLAAGTNKLLLRGKKTKISLKKDVRGGVLLVDNYSTGNPMAFKRKVRTKSESKRLTLLVNMAESGSISAESIFNKAMATATLVEELRRQNVSVAVYGYYAAESTTQRLGLIEMVPVKTFSERLQLHKLGAVLHPASLRQAYLGRACNKGVFPNNVFESYGEHPMGGGAGRISQMLEVQAVDLLKKELREDNLMVIPSVQSYKNDLVSEADVEQYVNEIVDIANTTISL